MTNITGLWSGDGDVAADRNDGKPTNSAASAARRPALPLRSAEPGEDDRNLVQCAQDGIEHDGTQGQNGHGVESLLQAPTAASHRRAVDDDGA